jgi:hypothetical protein
MHALRRGSGGTIAALHAVPLGCTPSVDEFRSQDFGLKAELGSTPWIGFLRILFCSRMER